MRQILVARSKYVPIRRVLSGLSLMRCGFIFLSVQSAEQAQAIHLKLTKKDNRAFMQFMIVRDHVQIVQDVPITVANSKQLTESQEPNVPTPDVRFKMPELNKLRIMIDRMKQVRVHISYGKCAFTFDARVG